MIKYYTYYNYGGYKDFWLGSNEDTAEYRYFLPLLKVYEADEEKQDKLPALKALPSIIYLSNQTEEYSYPPKARVMVSHAGYKLQYRRIGKLEIFALRNIQGKVDAYGRTCPFLMMFVADIKTDKDSLRKIAWYIWNHLDESESLFSSLFVNDFEVNGLRFSVKSMNEFISAALSAGEGTLEEDRYDRSVPFFVVSDDFSFADALKEQEISRKDVALAYNQSKTEVYRYEPFCMSQETEEHTKDFAPSEFPWSGGFGVKNIPSIGRFGFVREEDLKPLQESDSRHEKLIGLLKDRLAEAETRISELENKLSELTNNQN